MWHYVGVYPEDPGAGGTTAQAVFQGVLNFPQSRTSVKYQILFINVRLLLFVCRVFFIS